MNRNQGRRDFPQEMNTKESLYHTNEVDLGACLQKVTEQCLHCRVLQEVNKIIYIEAESEWGGQKNTGGIGWVLNKSHIEVWIPREGRNPKEQRIAFILLYQCLGLQHRPCVCVGLRLRGGLL